MCSSLAVKVCHFSTSTVDAPYFRNIMAGIADAGITVYCTNLISASEPEWLRATPCASYLSLGADSRRHRSKENGLLNFCHRPY